MIETLWGALRDGLEYFGANFDPVRDVIDIVLVTIGIYWLLMLIRGTRAFQILLGLLVLFALSVASEIFQLVTLRTLLENFVQYGVLIVIVLFQHDIRRALARVGRGFFPSARAAARDADPRGDRARVPGARAQAGRRADRARARDRSSTTRSRPARRSTPPSRRIC